jgi:LmbE family N-acetylglucosaminyl deacetylase
MNRRAFLTAATVLASIGIPPGERMVPMSTSPVLFVVAHPDDETLGMAVPLVEHLAGQDVHVLLLTDGEGTSARDVLNGVGVSSWWAVQHVPALEGYATLDPAAIVTARAAEHATALASMAAGQSGTLTHHEAHLPDGGVTKASAYAAILAVCDLVAPGQPVRIKGHSPVVDNHPDHVACGQALAQLSADDPTRFSDRRHYVLPAYWSDPRLSQVTHSWDLPGTPDVANRAVNACRAYGAWAPPGRLAVGWHSIWVSFATLMSTPKALQHL